MATLGLLLVAALGLRAPHLGRARATSRAAPRLDVADTPAQCRRAAVFAQFDADGDGFISARELGRAFERLDQPLTGVELRARMAAADIDSDARISLVEFEALCSAEEAADGELDYGFEPAGYFGADVGDPATPTNGFRSATENF